MTKPPAEEGVGLNRVAITISIMLATVMQSLDSTIANVALPHMQGSVSASQDQITWVLTSYIVAAAIATPLTGWLADRIGRKRLFLIAIAGFTVASMLCGWAENLAEIVGFRLLQGLFGACLIPLSQAVLLDIYPPRMHGQAMAIWGAGAILGPILGPFLGGLLTENLSWRWVFYINLPVGALAFAGVWTFIVADVKRQAKRFDFLGFSALSIFIACFQMMLDRGPGEDWFSSPEIVAWAVGSAAAFWVFVVHTATTAHPFFDRELATDRNFVVCTIFGFFVGVLLFSTMAVLPPMMQGLLGYPVLTSGIVSMPRGLGAFCSMFLVGRLIGKVDIRLLLATGLALNMAALWQMAHFDLSMTSMPIVLSGLLQGFGTGLIFVPMTALAFATLNPALRAEGSALNTLIRSLGMAAGISIVAALQTQNAITMRASLTEHVRPDSPVFAAAVPDVMNPNSFLALNALSGELSRQAQMVAYVDGFRMLFWITLCIFPLLLLMRKPKGDRRLPLSTPIKLLLSAGLAALLTGCATAGPDFKAPAAPKVARYAMAGDAAPALDTAARPAAGWWKAFGSSELDQVMAQALKESPTLVEADAAIERAQQEVRRQVALKTPQVDGTASVTRQRINLGSFGFSGGPLGNLSNPTSTLYSIGASVLYDLDPFGAGERGREAARARVDEQSRRADAAYLTLTGQVAMAAVRIAALNAELEAARAVVADGEQTLAIARKAEEAGAAAPASLSPSQAQVAADRAQIAPLEADLARDRHALALLVGQAPGGWTAPDFDLATFKAPTQIPVSLPSELVRKRPDILAAEAALHAATADIGVATAGLYPSFKLNAGFAQGALSPGDLFTYDTTGWHFGPEISVPLLDGGRRKAVRDASLAAARVADARYRQTVLNAFVQVADALDALGRDDDLLKARRDQAGAARQSFESARKAFDLGGGTLLAVVDAQRQLSRARRDLAVAQGDRYAHIVALFTAVAADWRGA